jgi:glyoxylase-like metal-dependent hydrolase (beta-lactamase superfamily II)
MEPLTIGSVRISCIIEHEIPTRPSWILPDATAEAVERHREWLTPYFLNDSGKFTMSIQSFVVETEELTVLVDTCVGNDKPRKVPQWNMQRTTFLQDLEVEGFPAETIDVVLCTHLHIDHVGWNTRLENGVWVPTFANARYLFAQREWDYWSVRNEDEYGPTIADSVRPIVEADQAELIEDNYRISDELRLEPTPGHTPGHVSLHITSEGQEAVITGDMMHHPIQCAEPQWNSRACADAEQARATRRAFLDRYSGERVTILGTHFASPTAGHIIPYGDAWRFRALDVLFR